VKVFNWYELKSCSLNIPEGIIILAYAISCGYNEIISSDEESLLKYLKIRYLPSHLYKNGSLVLTGNGSILSRYLTKEPQAYFKESGWLSDIEKVSNKIIYLYALGQRSINNKNIFIPETYLEDKYWNNPYLKHSNGNIWFLPELNKITNYLKSKGEK